MKYDEYMERIRASFAAAFRFMDRHRNARTSHDWDRIVEEMALKSDPLTVELMTACVMELEREYQDYINRTKNT